MKTFIVVVLALIFADMAMFLVVSANMSPMDRPTIIKVYTYKNNKLVSAKVTMNDAEKYKQEVACGAILE